LEIKATPEQIERLWQAASRGIVKEGNEYAEGAYAMIRALNGDDIFLKEVIEGCTDVD
jgi:hypothetical protein